MVISCPDNNRNEREYIIRYIFGELLGIQTEISFDSNVSEYIIHMEGLRRIIVEDHFFNRFPEDLSYFRKENLPDGPVVFHYEDESIPIIYGRDYIQTDSNQIVIGLDIFASSFFMLSRWEEYVLGREESVYDSHRFYQIDEKLLFCVRHSLTEHLLVHEYEFLLRRLMTALGHALPLDRKPELLITHDVDTLGARPSRLVLKHTVSLLRERSFGKAWRWVLLNLRVSLFCARRWKLFDAYIKEASKYGYRDVFLFKCCRKGETEYTYSISGRTCRKILSGLKNEQRDLGFHPSQSVFRNDAQFNEELSRFRKGTDVVPVMGRNHRLLHNLQTVRQWESGNVPFTSNWGYQTRPGFQCGIARPFPVFDIFSRKTSRVYEIPFAIMDSALKKMCRNERWGEDKKECFIARMVRAVARFGGILCINWHVNPFTKEEFVEGLWNYRMTLKIIALDDVSNYKF